MIVSEIKSNILDLMKISQTLNNIAMNKFHYEIENEYIQFLIDNLQEVAGAKLSVIKGLKDSQKYNNIFLEMIVRNVDIIKVVILYIVDQNGLMKLKEIKLIIIQKFKKNMINIGKNTVKLMMNIMQK